MQILGTHRVRLSDVEELAAHPGVGLAAASPLRPGPFSVEAVGLGLGDVSVQAGRTSPVLVQGTFPPGAAWLVLPLRHDGALLLNGRAAGPNSLAVYAEGAALEGASHADVTWAVVTLRTAALDRLELPRGSPVRRPGGAATLVCDPAAWLRAASLLGDAAEVAASDPEVFEVEEARRSLRSSVLEAVQELLAGPWGGEPPRIVSSAVERRRLVRAAEEVLRAGTGQVATTADLAAALGVPAGRLQRAIRATFGVGAQRYIQLRRLTMLRGALRRAVEDASPLSSAALAHGFWDLGRLAQDFRRIFGEDLKEVLTSRGGRVSGDGRATALSAG
jgi:AraC-like DNA-binding protein